jgi:dTDP-4-dehydrorhamnose reductase
VRTCGVFGDRSSVGKGSTFVDRIVDQGRAGEAMRVVSDVIASPTYAGHLADALRGLLTAKRYGLYHAVNGGPVSWYDFAVEILRQAGIDRAIEPIFSEQWKALAVRPAFSALANEKLRALDIEMPLWRDGIAAYLDARRERDSRG